MRVLIAEDDSFSRKIIEKYLFEWGYEVVSVTNGNDAIEELNNPDNIINMAILDWVMPGMSGLKVCRQIRSQKNRPFIYLIMLTVKNSIDDVATGFDAGIDDYIKKPFDKSELFYRIQAGERIVTLHNDLQVRIKEMEKSLSIHIELKRNIPICPRCGELKEMDALIDAAEKYIRKIPENEFNDYL